MENGSRSDVTIYVAQENIERFRKLLAVPEIAEAERARLICLLAEQEAILSELKLP